MEKGTLQTWVAALGLGAPHFEHEHGAPLQKFWIDKKSGAALLYLLIHSTPFGGPFQVKKAIFYLIFLFTMNVIQKMNLIRVEKVNLKNTGVLKKNLLVVLGHFN